MALRLGPLDGAGGVLIGVGLLLAARGELRATDAPAERQATQSQVS
ncbi:MAG TPA: hypothetical protein VFP65_18570 [Anaeromyxobacteraceae bacterium]|nr:hypothetical protein [Anaeromyxobacteraceae bacterium]